MDFSTLTDDFLKMLPTLTNSHPQRKINGFLRGEKFVLQYLFRHKGDAVPGEISAAMEVSTARIAVTLNSLEAKGLVTRRIDTQDRRRIVVELTEAGKDLALQQKQDVHQYVEQTLSALGDNDASEFLRILNKLVDIMKAQKKMDP